jgi:multidrug resistance efflux pump
MMVAILALVYCVGLYLIFVQWRLIPFTLQWQILCASVGVIALFAILLVMNYTQPFSVGTTVSGLATQIEARVPGKITEVNVKDGSTVKRGDVLFKMDPQPYASQLQQAKAALGEAEIKTTTAIQQATQNVNAAEAQVRATEAQIASMQATINASKTQLALTETRLKEYTELKEQNASSLFEVEKYQTDVTTLTDQIAAQSQGLAALQQQLVASQAQLAQAKTSLQEAAYSRPS